MFSKKSFKIIRAEREREREREREMLYLLFASEKAVSTSIEADIRVAK